MASRLAAAGLLSADFARSAEQQQERGPECSNPLRRQLRMDENDTLDDVEGHRMLQAPQKKKNNSSSRSRRRPHQSGSCWEIAEEELDEGEEEEEEQDKQRGRERGEEEEEEEQEEQLQKGGLEDGFAAELLASPEPRISAASPLGDAKPGYVPGGSLDSTPAFKAGIVSPGSGSVHSAGSRLTPRRFANLASMWHQREQPGRDPRRSNGGTTVSGRARPGEEVLPPGSPPNRSSHHPSSSSTTISSPAPSRTASMFASPSKPSQRGAMQQDSMGSPLVMRYGPDSQSPRRNWLMRTPNTASTRASRTSIATPETARKSGPFGCSTGKRTPLSPGTDEPWSQGCELEIALELVNVVPAAMADRLVKRLHMAEMDLADATAEREQAESELAAYDTHRSNDEDDNNANDDEDDSSSNSLNNSLNNNSSSSSSRNVPEAEAQPPTRLLGHRPHPVALLIAWVLLATSVLSGLPNPLEGFVLARRSSWECLASTAAGAEAVGSEVAGGEGEGEEEEEENFSSEVFAAAEAAATAATTVADATQAVATVADSVVEENLDTCNILLREAIDEKEDLSIQQQEIIAGYRAALQGVSKWIGFVNDVWNRPEDNGSRSHLDGGNSGCSSPELEARCVGAYEEGQLSLEKLVQDGAERGSRFARDLASKLERHRSRRMRLLAAPHQPTTQKMAVEQSFGQENP
eukprot:CAMPEP_0206425108 /NCGR_PEP_ID=MMETSP0324_2-20121206/3609_1 /ASSEMBLY_ACC=CAM_ASM_000836 /TAXON_ID=2866 /ORGANISM="Crypthecodinium cohnii, Strain Seligo" /LENGTH=692 /DNA_ID=CAMNT_0053889855 /DNA_START=69 /DNA_END=2147 /DNA_ORIENTATION=-